VQNAIRRQLVAPPILFLILAMTFTGANVPFGKIIVQDMPVFLFLCVRFAIATAALAVLMRATDWAALRAQTQSGRLDILILAGVGSVLFTVFLLEGTKRTSATEAGIIAATLPAVVAALAVVVLRHRIGPRGIAAIALSILGLVIIQLTGALATGGSLAIDPAATLLGNALVLAAVVCEAVFVLRSRGIATRLSPVALSFAVSAASLVLSLPLLAIETTQANLAAYAAIPMQTWGLAVWYALSASVFCTILWYAGVGRVASWQAGLATTALPVTAITVAAVALGESMTAWQAAGAGLVIAAIVIGALAKAPAPLGGTTVDADRSKRSDAP
jgi:drug/metabolite transporter (DMT)-like permease